LIASFNSLLLRISSGIAFGMTAPGLLPPFFDGRVDEPTNRRRGLEAEAGLEVADDTGGWISRDSMMRCMTDEMVYAITMVDDPPFAYYFESRHVAESRRAFHVVAVSYIEAAQGIQVRGS
jgi:hypothetical protein